MIKLKDIRYVRVGTRDIDAAVTFATRIIGLEVDVRDRHAAYLRSDDRDHTLVYLDAPADDHTVGFELGALGELDMAAAEILSTAPSFVIGKRPALGNVAASLPTGPEALPEGFYGPEQAV